MLPPKSAVVKIPRDPQTPVLQNKQLARRPQTPVTCRSAADQEAEELQKLPQYKFKPWELDLGILGSGPISSKKPPVKPRPQPIDFDLKIKKIIQDFK